MNYFDTLIASNIDDETSLDNKNNKEQFYLLMSKEGFDFTDIDDSTKLPKSLLPVIANETIEFNRFNMLLMKLNKEHKVTIMEAMIYLITDFLEETNALKCLDELNYITLKNELEKKFQIKNKDKGLSILDLLG